MASPSSDSEKSSSEECHNSLCRCKNCQCGDCRCGKRDSDDKRKNKQKDKRKNKHKHDISESTSSSSLESTHEHTEWPYRRYDGKGNHPNDFNLGGTNTTLIRLTKSSYADGKNSMSIRGANNPTPRIISNLVCRGDSLPHPYLSNLFWVWGQFVDHELDLTGEQSPKEGAPMKTPEDDPAMPNGQIDFNRSVYRHVKGIRQQMNQISSFFDGTNVYGSDDKRAYHLRKLDGTGHLRTTEGPDGPLLPFNKDGFDNAPSPHDPAMYVAGDVRANENVLLTAVHALFVREHNSICDQLVKENPEWKGHDERIFQEARRIIIAFQQVITYKHFLPHLLGPKSSCLSYEGYDPDVNPSVANEFSTVAYRIGHTMVSTRIRSSLDAHVDLKKLFFNPNFIKEHGVEGLLIGNAHEPMQQVDQVLIEDLRSSLFGAPKDGKMLDLASLNIQRGRDHGIPDYNTCRKYMRLREARKFKHITRNRELASKLRKLYGDVGTVDPWVAGLCEDHLPGALVGELFHAILDDQFWRARHGDRFWWENQKFPKVWCKRISRITLSKIIKRNTQVKKVPEDVFCYADPFSHTSSSSS